MSQPDVSRSREEIERADWSELMARAQHGDHHAYFCLLEQIVPYLRSRARRQLRSMEDVEDVVQDTLLTIHAIRQTYDPSRPFGPWLVAIAGRRIADRGRRRARIGAREVPLGPEHETFVPVSANLYEQVWQFRRLRQAVEDLPPAQRRAIQLLKLRQLSLKEAAVESGMSVAALKVATHRALKALRAILVPGQG